MQQEELSIVVARLFAFGALALLLCVSCGGHARVKSRTVPFEPGLQYDIDGNYLYLLCSGHGAPTVVLEAGYGDDHRAWSLVQPALAGTTRVCSYDRSGLGLSQLARKRATAREKADDLHALLEAADVPSPYVLVGHSYGGMLMRLFAATYKSDVAGVVLLDSSHPDQLRRSVAALPPARAGENAVLHELRAALASTKGPNPEGVNWTVSANETRAAGPLGETPLIVVTAAEHDWTPTLTPLPSINRRLDRAWLAMQDDLARLSSDSIHVIALYSPHYVMSSLGQPDLVRHAIRAVIRAVRAHTRLRSCRQLFPPPGAKCVSG